MAKLNMASINTLFRKGYLLAGVIMAANIFAVNEMKAMDKNKTNEIPLEDMNNTISPIANIISKDITRYILYWENYFNFFGTLALSGFDNYFKWYDYDAGSYFKLGCLGWRFKRLLNGIFQFEVNLNVGRGILWLIPGSLFSVALEVGSWKNKKVARPFNIILLPFFLTKSNDIYEVNKENLSRMKVIVFLLFVLRGFISMPLTFHISKINFSIWISLDSILWELVFIWAQKKRDEILDNKGGQAIIGERKTSDF